MTWRGALSNFIGLLDAGDQLRRCRYCYQINIFVDLQKRLYEEGIRVYNSCALR